MAITFGSDIGLQTDAFQNMIEGVVSEFERVKSGLADNFSRLTNAVTNSAPLVKERNYVDSGFQNVAGTAFVGSGNISSVDDVKRRRITTQTPQVTVYIKKKIFSALRNEHDSKFMDSGEKLFIRASKALFERKCSQVAAMEAMTKMERLIEEEAELDVARLEIIRALLNDEMDAVLDRLGGDAETAISTDPTNATFVSEIVAELNAEKDKEKDKIQIFLKEIDRLIGEARISKQAVNTTWVVDPNTSTLDRAKLGRGTGVIELTLVDSVRTSLSLEARNLGQISFNVQDPYNITSITNTDIELALASANAEEDSFQQNGTSSRSTISFQGPQEILDLARLKDQELKTARNSRLSTLTLGLLDPTNPLSGSDLSELVFEINPSSVSEYKVTGRISAIDQTFNIDNFSLVFAQLPSQQRLTFDETDLVKQIFKLLDDYVSAVNRLSQVKNEIEERNSTKYARRQLRKFYLGKHIVQPMDSVHIYMRSNTTRDSELMGPLHSLLSGSSFVRSFADGENVNDAIIEKERELFGIQHIPLAFYKFLRTGSFLRNAGTHVFGGLISSVRQSYDASRGEYTLQVSGESNLKWLNLSRTNVAPGLDQANGVLEDPLTPLEIEVDKATGVITGTPKLSEENRRRALYYKQGELKGKAVNEININQDVETLGGKSYAVAQHAPGMVYKWKEGIIVATQSVNLRTSLDSGEPEIDKLRRTVGVTTTKDPFANLDIADIISLLVTGFPHNYKSFLLNAQTVGTFNAGLGDNSPESFFHSFFDITRSTNRALGNFEPYKSINITREQMGTRLNLQSDLVNDNKEIKRLQGETARIQDQINQLPKDSGDLKNALQSVLDGLLSKLNRQTEEFAKSIEDNTGLKVYGDDIIVEDVPTSGSDTDAIREADKNARIKSNFLQIRPQVATKLNRDKNLFIVSDEYDKDLDIQAFVVEMLNSGEQPVWNSQYKYPLDICVDAAKVIDFEFFCNTAGHLEFRPPQYNKIPLSLLAKMLLLSDEKKVDLVPDFVKALFTTQTQRLEKTRELLKQEIAITNLFLFGTEEGKGTITNRANSTVSFSNDVLIAEDLNVDAEDVVKQIQQLQGRKSTLIGSVPVGDNSKALEDIRKEVEALSNSSTPNVNARRNEKLTRLLQLSSQKQRIDETLAKIGSSDVKVQTFGSTVKNATKGLGTGLLPGQLHSILEPFGNLLEDDFNDFLGPGSSQRFIIYDDQIIRSDFTESDANVYCRVDVNGQQDLVGDGPGSLSGIPWFWAGATDFDLWKQYGWRQEQAVSKPFFKDAELQCAPYALMLLSRQHRDVIQGEVTVAGNEYYQLGDVVYLNDKDMLYYVYAISHNFSYSGSFTTTLTLRYGHPLGEFIATPLDVIGKYLIQNQRIFNTTFMYRSSSDVDFGRPIGIIDFIETETEDEDEARKQMLSGEVGLLNVAQLQNVLLRVKVQKDNPLFDGLDIRGYIRKESQSDKVAARMSAVKKWLLNPVYTYDDDGNEGGPLDSDDYPSLEKNMFANNEGPILIPPIDSKDRKDLDKINEGRTPSEESYNFMLNPEDPDAEFTTIEIVMLFQKDLGTTETNDAGVATA